MNFIPVTLGLTITDFTGNSYIMPSNSACDPASVDHLLWNTSVKADLVDVCSIGNPATTDSGQGNPILI